MRTRVTPSPQWCVFGTLIDRSFQAEEVGQHTLKLRLRVSWNTMVASSFWDMRLSIACAATDAEYQNRIILHDNTLSLPVVARQPHPDPNYASFTAARLEDQPWRVVVSMPGARSSMQPLVRCFNSHSS